MEQSKIGRINTPYHKSQSVGLTEGEKKGQADLRAEYITAIHNNTQVNLNNISIQEKDGSVTGLGKKFGNIKEVQQAQGDIGMKLTETGSNAKETAAMLNTLGPLQKSQSLWAVARSLLDGGQGILDTNEQDVAKVVAGGMSPDLMDRLKLTPTRVKTMADELLQVAALGDPVGEVFSMKNRPNGLVISQKWVSIGVIDIIYEARPNVMVNAFGLCFKIDNVVILKGGSDALQSSNSIVTSTQKGLTSVGLPANVVQPIEDTSRETTRELMRMSDYVNVLIPRGDAGLVKMAVENGTIPVIGTGTGNYHILVDESTDFDIVLDIIYNTKTQRIRICNACGPLVVHQVIVKEFLLLLKERLDEEEVEIRGDEESCALMGGLVPATEED